MNTNYKAIQLSEHYEKMLIESELTQSLDNNDTLVREVLNGNTEIAWELVIKNCRIVANVLHKSFPYNIDDDAFSDGLWGFYVALTRLSNKYNISKTFYPYVASYIFCYVKRGMAKRQNLNLHTNKKEIISHNDIYNKNEAEGMDSGDDSIEDSNYLPYILEERDKIRFLSKIIKSFMRSSFLNDKDKIVFKSLIKHNGSSTLSARDLFCSKQNVFAKRHNIVKKLLVYLDKKHLEKEFTNCLGIKKEKLDELRNFSWYR